MDQLPAADHTDPSEAAEFPAPAELDSMLASAIRRLIAASQTADPERAEDAVVGLRN